MTDTRRKLRLIYRWVCNNKIRNAHHTQPAPDSKDYPSDLQVGRAQALEDVARQFEALFPDLIQHQKPKQGSTK